MTPMIGRRFTPGMKRAAWGNMQRGDFPKPVMHLKFGENTGLAAKDSSPNGNDGTIVDASWINGYLGPGLSFDGDDDYVTVADAESLRVETGNRITVVAWVNLEALVGEVNERFIVAKSTTWNNGWALRMLAVSDELGFRMYFDDASSVNLDVARTAGWVHLAGVYDGATLILYKDGVNVDDEAVIKTMSDTTGFPLYISHITREIKGIVDEVRVYNVALTPRQIKELYLGME